MHLKVEDGLYILTIDKAILVLSKDEFLQGLRRGKWWKRRQSLAPREAEMSASVEVKRGR